MPSLHPAGRLQPEVFKPLQMDQLLLASLPKGYSGLHTQYVLSNGTAWGRLTSDGDSNYNEVVGRGLDGVEENRALLVGALCAHGHFQPFSTADLRLGEELKHAKQSEAALEEVGDEALSTAIEGVQEHLEEIRRQYRAHRTADLNRFIGDDPSEIMVGLTAAKDRHTLGRDKLSGLALLDSVFYDSQGDDEDDTRKPKDTMMIRPVLAGQDGQLGTLPEDQVVRALFVQTSSMPVI
jgi:hypothetical protein